MDIDRNLKIALRTGEVHFGLKQAEKAVKEGNAKVIIRSKNSKGEPNFGSVKIITYPGTSMELGSACGKPFIISYLTIVDPGSSELTR